ncbi:MAG: tRNA 2-thiouridine(34) synthase MnmA [bacterium]|nr:tRNA 2-thiouridine(34) synthase MnmA [bacterium]
MNKKKLKIAVAMSGGVDSSVAAKLLKDQGHEVVGIFLHFWKDNFAGAEAENKCCSAEALLDARRVADKIGIPLYTLNFAKIFKKQVVDNFLAEYAGGRTPNPCVRCNKLVKLGLLIKQAKKLGFDYVASGHYARNKKTRKQENKQAKFVYKLYQAKDKNKDQSYFLYTFNQSELKSLLFPLGNLTKPQVRQIAKKFKLPVAEKSESQEICFISEPSHNEFLKRNLKLKSGPIVILERSASEAIESCGVRDRRDSIGLRQLADPSRMTDNKIIGEHEGLPLYTIGQRKGIKIGGSGPFYVAKMDYKKNILYVVNENDNPLIYKNELIAKNVNWLSDIQPRIPLKCQAVIRYRHKAAECLITKINNHNFRVEFSEPQRAITPGQSVVFYRGEEVLGGGIIK